MSIRVIKGPVGSGRRALADVMRNDAVQNGRGCLMLWGDPDASLTVLVEKLIEGEKCPEDVPRYAAVHRGEDDIAVLKEGIDAINWKKDCTVIVVGEKGVDQLRDVERRCPGFVKYHGPVTSVSTEIEDFEV